MKLAWPNFIARLLLPAAVGMLVAAAGLFALERVLDYTSADSYCAGCHAHPQATDSWKKGPHFQTDSGIQVGCVDCHLPPSGLSHYWEKTKAGVRDVYGYYFKDLNQIDWQARSALDQAVHYTFESACLNCHRELFPIGLTEKGVDAHLHYRKEKPEVRCINCHLTTGHFHEKPLLGFDERVEKTATELMAPRVEELQPGEFADYTETLPGTGVGFEMAAIQGGRFLMGSPPGEAGRRENEGPQREVEVSPFWMGKLEVSWDEYLSFFAATATRGKNELGQQIDAITGPTPPYGSPDQGWGKGSRPAITMTHYAARKYCDWLTSVTGRPYRLPTEAEWEYACRAGTRGPYFFQQKEEQSWLGRWFGSPVSEELLGERAWYRANSRLKTHPAGQAKQPNPWGLMNMLGNVREFCLDSYHPRAYSEYPAGLIKDPAGPGEGDEHVVRGGSFKSGPEELRSAWRDHTRHREWLKTDPQTPKSVWWYSDNNEVGFRIVRPYQPAKVPPGNERGSDE